MRALVLIMLLFSAWGVAAHPLAPALLELREVDDGGVYAVQWRTALVRALGRDVVPVMPDGCVADPGSLQTRDEGTARHQQWTLHCEALIGRELRVDGLDGSGVNVILRVVSRDGAVQQSLLDERHPRYTVLEPAAAPSVFGGYLVLGVEHLLFGFDHVLFVIGLVLLVRGARRLVWTITAFTLGHSLTLSLAVLGVVRVHAGFTEFMIALSILLLAVEILRPADARPGPFARWPWWVAAAFGLLHGLGFAGVLGEIGLPQNEIPLALFAFNLGIEIGQLMLIAAWLLAAALLRRLRRAQWPQALARGVPAYVIGTLAAYWCWERVAALV